MQNVGGGVNFGANTRDPNAEINRSDNNPEWQFRTTGSYLAPLDIQLSGRLDYRSGSPWARVVEFEGGSTIPSIDLNVEPIGTQRLPSIAKVDLRVEKRFALTDSHSVAVRVNFYNALNANTVLEVNQESGGGFGEADQILLPRIIDLAFIYRF